MTLKTDIIIIGAGMCGLSAGSKLSAEGKKVLILEGRDRTGGRVETHAGKTGNLLQAGPEFIHGNLPLTKALVKKTKGALYEHEGEMYRSQQGQIFPISAFAPYMDEFMKKLKALKKDVGLVDFLNTNFKGIKYRELRTAVTRTAEGFDAANAKKISAKSLYEEWSGDSMEGASLLKDGYGSLVKELSGQCIKNGCGILLSQKVKEIKWGKGYVKVQCSNGNSYEANKIIITASLGVLTSKKTGDSWFQFKPAIPEKIRAAKKMGFGPVIKVLVECKTRFWNDKKFEKRIQQIPDLAFLMNETDFPTLWFSNNDQVPLITCWAGGGRAEKIKELNTKELKLRAVVSLARAFNCPESFLKNQVQSISVFNWAKDEFAKGAYSYVTPDTETAKLIVKKPVEKTLYFAGEALGKTSGTVEAALESAEDVCKMILSGT